MSRLRRIARRAIVAIQRLSRMTNYELVQKHFYSPLPDLASLEREGWRDPRNHLGVDLKVEESSTFLVEDLAPFISEFRVDLRAPKGTLNPNLPFPLDNGGYGSVDAEILYAMLRFSQPRKVVEFGSGASSHVIGRAAIQNELEGNPFTHLIVDPYPFGNLIGSVDEVTVVRQRVEELDIAVVEDLESRDVLFVDTTHTVKTGGDVVRIILDLLPCVKPGVLIHFHDIFIPFEYPESWLFKYRRSWAEQYMLQAFLAYNDQFEIVMPANALVRMRPEIVSLAIPSFEVGTDAGAFWLRRLPG